MPQVTKEQGTEEWFAAREGKITASISAACLGIGKKKQLAAYSSIMGKRQADNGFMKWGRDHENHARAAYEIATGNLVYQTGFWVSDLIEWLGASPDGFIDHDGMLEVKCPAECYDAVPPECEIQCRVQMYVCNREWCDLFCWTQEKDFLHRFHRDGNIEAHILMALDTYYRTYIETQTPPPRRMKQKPYFTLQENDEPSTALLSGDIQVPED